MLSQMSGSGGPGGAAAARALISGPMSTITSFCTESGRFEVKYIAFRPPIESPTMTSGARPSWSTTPLMSSNATTGL